jgi:ribosomal-protein-alanine N-acetyltransferase
MKFVKLRFQPPPREELFEVDGARVRSFALQDCATVAQHLSDPSMSRHFSFEFGGAALNERDGELYLMNLHNRPRSLNYAGALLGSDEVIGSLNAQLGEGVHGRVAEFGGWMARPYWGSGFARAGTARFVDWLFQHHGVLRVFAAPFESNLASIGTLQACGFEYEGRLRCAVFKNGRTQDQLMFARLNPAASSLPAEPGYRQSRRAERRRGSSPAATAAQVTEGT